MRGIEWNPTSGRTLLGPPRTSKAMADLPPPSSRALLLGGSGWPIWTDLYTDSCK